jgi:hypothetical protein
VITTSQDNTRQIGDLIDLGTVPRDIGQGRTVYLVLSVSIVFAGGTTYQFILASDSQTTLRNSSSAGEEIRHIATDVIPEATWIQGFQIVLPLPMGGVEGTGTYKRYLGLLLVDVGSSTSGNIDAFLTYDPHGWTSYPDASN